MLTPKKDLLFMEEWYQSYQKIKRGFKSHSPHNKIIRLNEYSI